jgi:serine/threonine-protein kinase HipA
VKSKQLAMQPVVEIKVGLDFGAGVIPVGRLAMRERRIYFEYDAAFIKNGFEISPFRLPLKSGLVSFDNSLFEGLPGVFNDSLPDGWGRLLFDRYARSQGVVPSDITPLQRLAYVGSHGMGALVYQPDYTAHDSGENVISLDTLADQAQQVLHGEATDVLSKLLALNGSSAGARPKALVGLDAARQHIVHGVRELPANFEHWLVKFHNTTDGADAGAIEYVYALMAKAAGIDVPDVHLFSATRGAGYFAIRRFDRDGNRRLHMHTACGLLHSDYRAPSLDYEDLIALTTQLTRDMREVEKMYRLAVFNVLAHNRDDHAKNFSFLMNAEGLWSVSPAYDLTFSSGPRGEQSTMVMGEGRNPSVEHLIKLGAAAKIAKPRCQEIIAQTQSSLDNWHALAKENGVSATNIRLVASRLKTN